MEDKVMEDKGEKQRERLAKEGYIITHGWFHKCTDEWNEEEERAKVPYGYELLTTMLDLKMSGNHMPQKLDPQWYDHAWTLEKDGVTIYSIEPYHFDGESWGEMAKLADGGWEVEIMGAEYAVHNPGETIVIWIWKRKEIG